MNSENKKCMHCGAELPMKKKKVVKFPKINLKQIYYLKCPKCKKENKIIFRPSTPRENQKTLRMFLLLG